MSDPFQQIVRSLAENVDAKIRKRGPGHCLVVSGLPFAIADGACQRLHEYPQTGEESYEVATVVETRGTDWHATPTKAVELRNKAEETGGRLALFVPSGVNLPAEDSFGPSTFEILDVGNLEGAAVTRLEHELEELDPGLAEIAIRIADIVRDDSRFMAGARERLGYLSRLVTNPRRDEIGLALVEFGLLPDRGIAGYPPDEIPVRLHRNLQQMTTLTEAGTPEERIRQLPLERERKETPGIVRALLDASEDGTSDRLELARRLDTASAASAVDFEEWHLDLTALKFDEFRIMELIGDLTKGVDQEVKKANGSVGIRLRCRPAPANLTGLKELTLELVRVGDADDDLSETGVEAVRRGKALPKGPETQWKLKLPANPQEVPEGVYCFRVRAYNEDNLMVAADRSENFRIGDVAPPERRVAQVTSVAAAAVGAVLDTADLGVARTPLVAADQETEATAKKPSLSLGIRFERTPSVWELRLSRTLVALEHLTLDDADSLGRYTIALGGDVESVQAASDRTPVPERFIAARRRVFRDILTSQYEVAGEAPTPLIALTDLAQLADSVEEYVRAWADGLDGAASEAEARALLSVDQVSIVDQGKEEGRLVGPTHPLRMAWLLRYQQRVAKRVTAGIEREEVAAVQDLLRVLRPMNIPFVVPGDREALRHVDDLDLSWGLWATSRSQTAAAVAARVRAWLYGERTPSTAVPVADVVARLRRYLLAHPYVELLVVNYVQPGLGETVLEALLTLQREPTFQHLRHQLRLFATDLTRSELGSALDEFMNDPDSARTAKRDEADAFLSAADDPLAPKLTYSKHSIDELVREPEAFPAHVSIFLDWFDLKIVPSAAPSDRQSFFGGGLVVDPVVSYRAGGERMNPQWDSHVVGEKGDGFADAYRAAQEAGARLLGAREPGVSPAIRLDLDRVRRSVLDAIHRTSDWVVVIDPVFSDELFDAPADDEEQPRYLIDYVGDQGISTSRRIVVSTRSREEIPRLLKPIAGSFGLELAADRAEGLLDALQVLGAGLPLKLLNNRTQALEAFSLALASTYLAERGVFRHALAIPLDLHQELFREPRASANEDAGLSRTDIALVRVTEEEDDPHLRFAVSLVEVKARASLPEQIPGELVDSVSTQLENSREVLRARLFGTDLSDRQREFEGVTLVHRLARVLVHYAERASRYGYLDGDRLTTVRRAAARLEAGGFRLSFEKQALIFDFSGESQIAERMQDVVVTRVGRTEIDEMLDRVRTPLGTAPFAGGDTELVGPALLPGPPTDEQPQVDSELVELTAAADRESVEDEPAIAEGEQDAEDARAPGSPNDDLEWRSDEDVRLLGSAERSAHFGIIGRIKGTGDPVALDVGGTNTVCVFGAPGYGKSYTVGAMLEGALIANPALGRLPGPLAAVVFHYATDDNYAPEFVSMFDANDDPREVETLRRDFGTGPDAVRDLRLLVPERRLDARRGDYPHLEVHPLRLSAREIGLNEWQLLMGVTGGEQMYVRAMNRIFGSVKEEVTVAALRAAVEASELTPNQKQLAGQRLGFAETYVGDVDPVSNHLAPGRLLVVDLRDPLISQDEALAMFMVLLRTLGQVEGPGGREINKLFVFDEAHNYMRDSRLRTEIETNVRQRRHRGTTVVLASQDPPSIPAEIVGLSNIIVAHHFNVPGWLDYLRKHKTAFHESELKPSQLAALDRGEAFVWSEGGAQEFRRPQRVEIRPRLTRHGGATRRAIEWQG